MKIILTQNFTGTLNPENYPTTESEYEDYTMTCYIPFTTTWQYQIANDPGQHSFYIPEGGILRVFEAPSDNMAAWNLGWGFMDETITG